MQQTTIKVGITGGIGSGKSFICKILAQRSIPVFYADDEAKLEMLQNIELQKSLSSLLGKNVLLPDGTLNKNALSSFLSEGEENARQVNALVHPAVRQRMQRWIDSQSVPLVVVECALLFESGYHEDMDYVVAVNCAAPIRLERAIKRSGYTEKYVRSIMSKQWTDEQRSKLADYVILNDGVHSLAPQMRYFDNLLSERKDF